MSGFDASLSITLAVIVGIGAYNFGIWRERQRIPEYHESIVSRAACDARIKDASDRILKTFESDPVIYQIIKMQASSKSDTPKEVLNFCFEIIDLATDGREPDFYRR